MNSNERFGQIEAMLAELLRRMDRQSGQIDDIIGILKISDARQTRTEERQEAMLAEIKQQGARLEQQGNQIEKQGARLEEQGTRIKEQGERLDKLLQTQMKMLELMSYNANRTDELERKFPVLTAYEARFQRLEDAVFNKAG